MANDLRNLTNRVDKARLGNSIGQAIPPTPQFKPFVPPVSSDSDEARRYSLKYGVAPHEMGDAIRRGITDFQVRGQLLGSDLEHRPIARLGAQDFNAARLLPLPFDTTNALGMYFPPTSRADPNRDEAVYETRNILGENERLLDDFIVTTKRGGRASFRHELTHRALRKLRNIEAESEGRVPPRFSLMKELNFWNEDGFRTRSVKLNEEDVIKLLDYASGDRNETAKNYFSLAGKWKYVKTTPDELLKSPDILELLMTIQQFAAEELEKQGIDTPIHFPQTK